MQKYIRTYKSGDCDEIIRLFRETVHSVNAKDYSQEQLNAWAPEEIDYSKWSAALEANHTVVVISDNIIIGFGDIDNTGYFDHIFVHKDFQRQGVAAMIADEIELHAGKNEMRHITVAASITAKPFFEKRGYTIVKEQQVERNRQVLVNFLMEFTL